MKLYQLAHASFDASLGTSMWQVCLVLLSTDVRLSVPSEMLFAEVKLQHIPLLGKCTLQNNLGGVILVCAHTGRTHCAFLSMLLMFVINECCEKSVRVLFLWQKSRFENNRSEQFAVFVKKGYGLKTTHLNNLIRQS